METVQLSFFHLGKSYYPWVSVYYSKCEYLSNAHQRQTTEFNGICSLVQQFVHSSLYPFVEVSLGLNEHMHPHIYIHTYMFRNSNERNATPKLQPFSLLKRSFCRFQQCFSKGHFHHSYLLSSGFIHKCKKKVQKNLIFKCI